MTANPWLMLLLGAMLGWSLLSGGEKPAPDASLPAVDPDDEDPA